MKTTALLIATILLAACATSDEQEDRREETAIADFIEVNELVSHASIRTMEQYAASVVSNMHVIISTRKEDYLLEYFTRCRKRINGRVDPDYRKDARTLYAKADTYRGCRIKAIYALQPGQADEIRELGGSVGGDK